MKVFDVPKQPSYGQRLFAAAADFQATAEVLLDHFGCTIPDLKRELDDLARHRLREAREARAVAEQVEFTRYCQSLGM